MLCDRFCVDAQQMRLEHPEKFYAPPASDLNAITPGDYVKICAFDERFWTKVIKRDGDIIWATVANNLICSDWGYGKKLRFNTCHVYDIRP